MKSTYQKSVSWLEECRNGEERIAIRWHSVPDPKTGKQKRFGKIFKHVNEARAFYIEKLAEQNRGIRNDPIFVTIMELTEEFKDSRLATQSYASQISYQTTIDQLIEYFGSRRKITDILQRHAEAFIASRKRVDGRPGVLSGWSLARHVIQCRAIFAAAVAWGYIPKNPFRIDRHAGTSPLRTKAKSRPWQAITPDEFKSFLAAIPDVRRRAIYILMFVCALRAGEVYSLIVANIDLNARRIHIRNRAATPDMPPFTVKADGQSSNSKERVIPIPEWIVPDLTAAIGAASKSGGFIALTPTGFKRMQKNWQLCREGKGWAHHGPRPWQNRDTVNNCLRDAKQFFKKAGVELTAPLTLHTFRKSFAQNLANAGVPPKTLAQLLGHSDPRISMEFYNRVTDENTRAAGEIMNRLMTASEEPSRNGNRRNEATAH